MMSCSTAESGPSENALVAQAMDSLTVARCLLGFVGNAAFLPVCLVSTAMKRAYLYNMQHSEKLTARKYIVMSVRTVKWYWSMRADCSEWYFSSKAAFQYFHECIAEQLEGPDAWVLAEDNDEYRDEEEILGRAENAADTIADSLILVDPLIQLAAEHSSFKCLDYLRKIRERACSDIDLPHMECDELICSLFQKDAVKVIKYLSVHDLMDTLAEINVCDRINNRYLSDEEEVVPLTDAACMFDALECLQYLYQKRPNKLSHRPCWWAIVHKNVPLLEWLMTQGHGDYSQLTGRPNDDNSILAHVGKLGSIPMITLVQQAARGRAQHEARLDVPRQSTSVLRSGCRDP